MIEDYGVKIIFEIINSSGGEARMVGGCVRDIVLNFKINDIDFATTCKPNEIINIFEKKNIKAIPTGIKHGTITVVIGDKNYEITTLRKDLLCDGRHADVIFTNSWIEDAKRRDFTFNAMYIDINDNLYDYFDGMSDLKNGVLRFVGDPSERILEDHLRILRAFRFYVRFCRKPMDYGTFNAITSLAHKIKSLSGERIQSEIFRLLELKNSNIGISLMADCMVFFNVFDISFSGCDFLKAAENIDYDFNYIVKFILIAIENKININNIFNYWKLSNKNKKYIKFLIENYKSFAFEDFNKKIPYVIRVFGLDCCLLLIEVLGVFYFINNHNAFYVKNNIIVYVKIAKNITIPKMPLNGDDFLAAGVLNKEIGDCISFAWNKWEESGYEIDKNQLLEYVLVNKRLVNKDKI